MGARRPLFELRGGPFELDHVVDDLEQQPHDDGLKHIRTAFDDCAHENLRPLESTQLSRFGGLYTGKESDLVQF